MLHDENDMVKSFHGKMLLSDILQASLFFPFDRSNKSTVVRSDHLDSRSKRRSSLHRGRQSRPGRDYPPPSVGLQGCYATKCILRFWFRRSGCSPDEFIGGRLLQIQKICRSGGKLRFPVPPPRLETQSFRELLLAHRKEGAECKSSAAHLQNTIAPPDRFKANWSESMLYMVLDKPPLIS